MDTREYLESILPTREEVARFLKPGKAPHYSKNSGWCYDAELGWLLSDSIRQDGVEGSRTFFHYEADGARQVLSGAGAPCRIHCYGDSMTHGDQVSDGETWPEYLAGHLREPVRNYGIGGYSVYQAFRRLRRVEAQNPAEYVILNIFDDDHFRNLDAWRSIRFGRRSPCGFTLPHLQVNVAQGLCREVENILPRPEDVVRLTNLEFVWDTFREDPVLQVVTARRRERPPTPAELEPVAVTFGLPPGAVSDDEQGDRLRRLHSEAALFATRQVLNKAEEFLRGRGQKLIVVLSRSQGRLRKIFAGESPRWDQSFLDFLKTRPYPVVDLGERLLGSVIEPVGTSRIIVIESALGLIGLAVDAASEVVTIDASEIRPAPQTVLVEETSAAFEGVVPLGERLVVLVDPEKALPGAAVLSTLAAQEDGLDG